MYSRCVHAKKNAGLGPAFFIHLGYSHARLLCGSCAGLAAVSSRAQEARLHTLLSTPIGSSREGEKPHGGGDRPCEQHGTRESVVLQQVPVTPAEHRER